MADHTAGDDSDEIGDQHQEVPGWHQLYLLWEGKRVVVPRFKESFSTLKNISQHQLPTSTKDLASSAYQGSSLPVTLFYSQIMQ